ncbi:MAG: metallophosphoesterase [Clostridiaceae bacterium]|nr:metallophosphoesterase [Clostridiaceae bacterium]
MRALVISDTHGDIKNAKSAIKLTSPDVIFHLGDLVRDAIKLKEEFSHIPIHYVKGNNDFSLAPAEQVVDFGGYKIYLCHGHQFDVHYTLNRLMYRAQEKGAHAVLFGHTHRSFYETYEDIIFLNPGSPSRPRDYAPSAGVLEIEKNKLKAMIFKLM